MCCYPGQNGHAILEFFKEKVFQQKCSWNDLCSHLKTAKTFFFSLVVFIDLPIHAREQNQADTYQTIKGMWCKAY